MSVSLDPSPVSPVAVGDVVTWTATVTGADPGGLWYRFRARWIGRNFQMIRDFAPNNALDWTASEHEGGYEVEVKQVVWT